MKNFDMHRILVDRRSFLLGGIAAPALLISSNLRAAQTSKDSSCILDVELTQGPYYLDRGLLRKNITESKPGLALGLALTVLDSRTCAPVPNAGVEIWHCDAVGIYSGYVKASMGGPGMGPGGFGGPPPPGFDPSKGPPPGGFPGGPGRGGPGGPPPQMHATDAGTFFRGLQFTNAQGMVEFDTIYPGWYMGRDTHIHLKVHTGGDVNNRLYQGGHVVHTGQLFFPDDLSDEIAQLKPYSEHHRVVRTRLDEDMVFADAHGTGLILKPERVKSNALESGMMASAVLHVDPTAINEHDHPPNFGR